MKDFEMSHDDKATMPYTTIDAACSGDQLRFAASDIADVAAADAKTAAAILDHCTATISLGLASANPTFGFAKY